MGLVTTDDVSSSPIDIMTKLTEYYITIDRNRAISKFNKRYSLKYTLSLYEGDDNINFNALKESIESDLNALMRPFFNEYDVTVEVIVKDNEFTVAFDLNAYVDGYPYNLNRVASIINGNIKKSDEYLDALEKYIRRYRWMH